jgi:hypothetical protein
MAIRISGRIEYDVRNNLYRMSEQPLTANQIFKEVKLKRPDLIRIHAITDAELMDIITKVKSGWRNVLHLAPGENYARLRDISNYIVNNYTTHF